MLLDAEQCSNLIDQIKRLSKADALTVTVHSKESARLRFAENNLTSCGTLQVTTVTIKSDIGVSSASVAVESTEIDEIAKALRSSEELAKLAPENPEYVAPFPAGSNYLPSSEYFNSTASVSADQRVSIAEQFILAGVKRRLKVAGFIENISQATAIGNSNGVMLYHPGTSIYLGATGRTQDGTGSSKFEIELADSSLIELEQWSEHLAERAVLSSKPIELPAREYPTILEPSATADMVANMFGFMSRRSADEGRSFFSKPNGANRIGELLANNKVNVLSNPNDLLAPTTTFSYEGVPLANQYWIKQGVLEALPTDRYWAGKQSLAIVPNPQNIIMQGEQSKGLQDLIASLDKGILVSKVWYIRPVDPEQILLTGLTRDGTFLIEKGKIVKAVNNYRYNESPIRMLKNLKDLSCAVRTTGNETWGMKVVAPAVLLEKFGFSTVSQAV